MPDHVSDYAEKEMAKLNVHILRNSKVISTTTTASGQTEVTFENGQKKVVDLYLPTSGVIRNTEFVPESLRNAGGDVKVDEYLRSSVDASIWALGDVVDVQPAGLVNTQSQSKSVASNLNLVLNGKEPVVYKKNMKRKCSDNITSLALTLQVIGGVTLGRDKGTGRFGNMKIPSFPIWFLSKSSILSKSPLLAQY